MSDSLWAAGILIKDWTWSVFAKRAVGSARPRFAAQLGRRASSLGAILTMVAALLLVAAPHASAAPKPSVALSPSSGPPGTQVTVTGQNWPAGHGITVSFPDRGFTGPGGTTVGPDGSFTFSFTWPSPARPGDHQVAVISRTGPVADAPPWPIFTVTPGSPSPPPSTPAVTVGKAYVANSNWAEATQFNPGDLVRYQIVLAASSDAAITVKMRVAASDGRLILDSAGDVVVSPTHGSMYVESTIPSEALPGTYTQTATVIFNGVTTVRTSRFTVAEPPRSPGPGNGEGVVQILMPFSGKFANGDEGFEGTAPGKHPYYWPGMQWATDIYAVPGTSVKANFSGTGVSLKVAAVGEIPDCYSDSKPRVEVSAGKYVTVSVSLNGQNIGSVHYQHLAGVSLQPGAEIPIGTTLGTTSRWAKSGCWRVNTDAGVHTHLEVKSTAGSACYVAHPRGRPLSESDMIGSLRNGGYPTLECPN